MPLAIRLATPADAPQIVEFNRLMALETEGKALDLPTLTRGVEATFSDPHKGPYYLAVDGDSILGQLQITFEWSDWRNGWFWWIQSVYVRPEARQRGAFRALYEHVVKLARQTPEVLGIRLYVERENQRAQEAYLRLGMARSPYAMMEHYPL